MSSRYRFQSPAFILHRRDYGESSRILSCFTREYGRVDMVCKGCRKSGKSSKVLEPFRRYHLSWTGKSDLKTLVHADESRVHAIHQDSRKLYCGLYLNELLHGLIRAFESEPDLFELYEDTLHGLAMRLKIRWLLLAWLWIRAIPLNIFFGTLNLICFLTWVTVYRWSMNRMG